MRKYLAVALISSLVIMLLQQMIAAPAVSAAAEPFIYPTKDKFYDGSSVYDGEDLKNYVGYDSGYGEHTTYMHYSLAGIDANKSLESVKLIIPILNGYVSRTNSSVDPYINVYRSSTDSWSEAGTLLSDLPTYNPAADFLEKKSFDFLGSSSGLLLEYDVTSFIKTQLGVLDQQASFILTGPTVADTNSGAAGVKQNIIMLDDQESGGSGRPYLQYVYAPNQPPTGTIQMNSGDAYTNSTSVTLGLTYSDPENDDVDIEFSNNNVDWSAKAPFNGTKAWSLSAGDGSKTVYMRLTDEGGNTAIFSDTIILDTTAPVVTGIANGEVTNDDVTPTFDEGTATLNGNAFTNGTTISAEGSYSLIVTDNLGHVTTVAFTIDKTLPDGSIVINDNDATTIDADVSLTINASDADEVEMRLSDDGVNWGDWKAVSSIDWMLPNGFGEKTVYLELKDTAGNTKKVSDKIVYRSVPAVNDSNVNGSEDIAFIFSGNDFLYSNADGTPLDEITILTLPANGKLQLSGTDVLANDTITALDISNLQFISPKDWNGETSFEWTAAANTIPAAVTAILRLSIAAVNDEPAVQNVTYSTMAGAKIEDRLAASDADADSITFTIVDQPAKGKLTLHSATGNFSFEPEAGHYEDVTFTYKANDGQADSNVATVTIVNRKPPSSGCGCGGEGSTIVPIKIEGLIVTSGVRAEVTVKDGEQVAVVSLDGEKLTELIKNVKDNELTIEVGSTIENVELAMDLELIKQLNNSKNTVRLIVSGTGYGLSLSAVRGVLRDWNDADAQLKIEIIKADAAAAVKLKKLAEDKGYTLLVTPKSYQLYFQSGSAGVQLPSVKGYITISYGDKELKGKKPKTAVLLLPSGNLVHVPTKLSNTDGQLAIHVHSFANGVFTLIDFEKTFEDASGWSKPYIEELAARLIIQGTGDKKFEPKRSVTRAEFTAVITRALGLYKEPENNLFTDVSEGSWFAGALTAASEYGLISGYADGSFHPNADISREEAMVILARAFSLMELEPSFTQAELDAGLASFEDRDELHSWSAASVRLTVLLGIVNGSNNRLHPSESMTREQLAAVVVKLLQSGQFI